jgi:hypothetical protein
MACTERPCEICEAPATGVRYDVREGETVMDGSGITWRSWRPETPHYFCNEHRGTPVQRIYANGTVGSV